LRAWGGGGAPPPPPPLSSYMACTLEAVAQPWHGAGTVVCMKVSALVSDERWALVEPLLPPHPSQPKGGNR